MKAELQWVDEMGEVVCNPVTKENGVRYELYNDRVGKAFAVLYVGREEIVIPSINRDEARIKCQIIADALTKSIETGFARGVEYALKRYRDFTYQQIQDDIRMALEEKQHIPPNPLP